MSDNDSLLLRSPLLPSALGHGGDDRLAPAHELEFHAREISFACDCIEAYLDENAGFDLTLFRGCKRLLDKYQQDISEYKAEDDSLTRQTKLESLYYLKGEGGELTLLQRMSILLEEPDSSRAAFAVFVFLTLCVLVSCISVVIATLPSYNPLVVPKMQTTWTTIDWATTAVFTVETGARLYLCIRDNSLPVSKSKRALRFLRNPYNIVDVLALLPTYLQNLVPGSSRIITGQLRTVRLLRIFRFLRRYKPVRMLLKGLWTSAFALIAPAACYTMFLFFLSSVAYFTESGTYKAEDHTFWVSDGLCESEPGYFLSAFDRLPYLFNASTELLLPNITIPPSTTVNFTCPPLASKFLTIGQTCWFGVATFSTNGFGEFVPQTPFGKFTAVVMLAAGLMIAAMPLAVVDSSYVTVLERERDREESLKETTALGNAEASSKALMASLERGEDHRTPGEALLLTLWSMTNLQVLDMRAPRHQDLMLLDLLIEGAVKQLVNAAFEYRQLRPPFAASTSSEIAVWVATTTTNVGWESCGSTRPSVEGCVRVHQVLTNPLETVLGATSPGDEDPGHPRNNNNNNQQLFGDNIFSLPLLQHLEQYRVEVVQGAVKGKSAAFAMAVGETRLPPLKLLLSNDHARIVLFRSWGVTRPLLLASPSCVVKVYRKKAVVGGTILLDVLRVKSSYSSFVDRNVPYASCPSQVVEFGNQLLLQMRERVDKNFFRRSGHGEGPGDATKHDTSAGGDADGEQPTGTVMGGPGHDDMNRFAILQQAQSAADEVVEDPMDYAEAAAVLQSEPSYFLLRDGDVLQFGGDLHADHRAAVSKVMLEMQEIGIGAVSQASSAGLVDLAVHVNDAVFYNFRM